MRRAGLSVVLGHRGGGHRVFLSWEAAGRRPFVTGCVREAFVWWRFRSSRPVWRRMGNGYSAAPVVAEPCGAERLDRPGQFEPIDEFGFAFPPSASGHRMP